MVGAHCELSGYWRRRLAPVHGKVRWATQWARPLAILVVAWICWVGHTLIVPPLTVRKMDLVGSLRHKSDSIDFDPGPVM